MNTIARVPKIPEVTRTSRLLISLGQGCGIRDCNCSPGYWLYVSDGDIAFNVHISQEQAEQLRRTGKLETGLEVSGGKSVDAARVGIVEGER